MRAFTSVLLTGPPGIGKTTLIRTLAKRLARFKPVGFYTEEIRDRGVRQGFRLVTLDGRTRTLSHVDYSRPTRIGRYGVDVAGFESTLAALGLNQSPSRLVIIDEIGKMECLSRKFVEEMKSLLDSTKTVLATVASRGEGFIREVKDRPDCKVIAVTKENRDRLVEELPALLTQVLENH